METRFKQSREIFLAEKEVVTMAKKQKQLKTVVAFILDKSGSMAACQNAAISGFNEYLQTTKRQNKVGMCQFNLTLFDTHVFHKYQNLEVHEVQELNHQTYIPDGSTALYDAAVSTIEKIAEEVKHRHDKPAVLVAIMTDGQENASVKENEQCLRDLIERLKKEGNYTFVFMGANQDSYAVAQSFGISRGNTMNWTSDARGTSKAFRNFAGNSLNYMSAVADNVARGVNASMDSFFSNGGDKHDSQP